MLNDCIIMAGGSGTRLWPASNSKRPKQFLSLPSGLWPGFGSLADADTTAGTASHQKSGSHRAEARQKETGGTFFGASLERALAVTADSGDGRVIIIAGKSHMNFVIEECAKLDEQEKKRLVLIPEPHARNTAPAIACALVYIDLISAGRERNVLVLTSDHIIKPLSKFKSDTNAAAAASGTGKLVVFGIPPLRPETGYGYIEAAGPLPIPRKGEVFVAASFREKPDIKTAKAFISSKNFYWNSGMFAFSTKIMISEFRRSAPEVIAPFIKLEAPDKHSYSAKKGLKILDAWNNLETAYRKTKSISFDYAIAEKCRSVAMVKAHFSWTDVGNWDEYARLTKKTNAEVYGTDDTCFVDSDIPVALCGVENLIVVVKSGINGGPAAVLVAKKGETQRIKEIVEEIKASGRTDLL